MSGRRMPPIARPSASRAMTGGLVDANSIGGYKGLKWYLDGKRQTGNPQTLILKPHQEIAFVVGKPPAKIPSSYVFPAGE